MTLRFMRVATGASLLLVAAGCAPDAPTAITLHISTEFRQPGQGGDGDRGEINALTFAVKDAAGRIVLPGSPLTWTLAAGGKGVLLPQDLALVRDGDSNGPLTIDIEGWIGPRRLVSRRVQTSFVDRHQTSVEVNLSRECLSVTCPSGGTCVPGFGCMDPKWPPREAAPSGTPCDCKNRYFPLCVRAWWTYDVYQANYVTPTPKTWSFPFYGSVGSDTLDVRHDVAGKAAFLQFRSDVVDVTRRWVLSENVAGKQKLSWIKDEAVDFMGKPHAPIYYQKPKLRFDESLGDLELPVEFNEFRYRESVDTEAAAKAPMVDKWTRVPLSEVLAKANPSRFPQRWLDREVLCHRRRSQDLTLNTEFERYFCFAKGVGKIYELTPAPLEEEILRSYHLPGEGCPGLVLSDGTP